ncbi:MAG: DUF1573 domain-containing protein [Planctomycetota bacterium]|nr:DUF1573 domain-containing protein [Planctomycetota bacterium]
MTLDSPLPTDAPPADESARGAVPSAPRWVPILSSILCVGLMVVVLVLANSREQAPGASPPPPGAVPDRDATDLYGTPTAGDPQPIHVAGCGDLDPSRPPRVEIETGEVDFGNLKQGVAVSREVTFRSVGQGPLCIASVKSGCGCVKATLVGTKRRYEPGESGAVLLVVDTTGRMGEINKRIDLISNDPVSPLTNFRVKMDVNAGLVSDPRYLQFGNVPPRTSASRSVYLRTTKDDREWAVKGVRSVRVATGAEPVEYAFEVEEIEDPTWRRVKVRVVHPGMAQTGSFHDRLVIETTHPERAEVEIETHIHVVPRIVFRANTVSLGFVRAGAPHAPTRARIQEGAPGVVFQITSVEVLPAEEGDVPPGGVPFEATFGKDGRGWWVDVTYDGKARKPGLVKAVLRVTTDDSEQPELKIPVRATLQAPH